MELKKIKVVHISTSVNGGAGSAAYRIHLSLLNNNIDSHFLCLDDNLPKQFIECSKFEKKISIKKSTFVSIVCKKIIWKFKNNIKIYNTRKHKLNEEFRILNPQLKCDFASLPFAEYNILNNPKVQNADIIHLHWVAGFLDYESFFKKNKIPIVWTLHDMNPFQGIFHYKEDEYTNTNISFNLNKVILELKQNWIKKSRAKISIVCPSFWLLNCAKNSKIFKKIESHCIRNTINLNIYFPSEISNIKTLLKIPKENTIFLFISENVTNKRKGIDLLINALKYITNPKITLLIIGHLEIQIKLDIDIKILGAVKNQNMLSQYYSVADAFILPSREDNLPNVMLESMACGTPVLAFNVGGMSEVIEDGFNGLKVYSTDAAALTNIIENFIKTKEQYIKKEIQHFANKNFSNNIISEKYSDLYKSILKNKNEA